MWLFEPPLWQLHKRLLPGIEPRTFWSESRLPNHSAILLLPNLNKIMFTSFFPTIKFSSSIMHHIQSHTYVFFNYLVHQYWPSIFPKRFYRHIGVERRKTRVHFVTQCWNVIFSFICHIAVIYECVRICCLYIYLNSTNHFQYINTVMSVYL